MLPVRAFAFIATLVALLAAQATATPSGFYCGTAVNTPSEFYLGATTFVFKIFGASPCQFTGYYTMAGSAFRPSNVWSTCPSTFVITHITYSSARNELFVAGTTSQGAAWSGISTHQAASCAPATVSPSGYYCGSAMNTPSEVFVGPSTFSFRIFGSNPCQISGSYTMAGNSITTHNEQSTCASTFVVSRITYSIERNELSLSGTSHGAAWSGTGAHQAASCAPGSSVGPAPAAGASAAPVTSGGDDGVDTAVVVGCIIGGFVLLSAVVVVSACLVVKLRAASPAPEVESKEASQL